jgi:uncharacterized protein YndB with AHSA1/START domain
MTATAIRTTQVYSIFIHAAPERVWEAITKPEFTRRYFYGSEIDSMLQPGSRYRSWASGRDRVLVEGEVVECEPPRRFVHTWTALYDEETAREQPSRVSWELEPQEGGVTKLTVVHDRLENAPKTAQSVAGGWMFVLSSLKSLLETGEPLPS